MYGPVRQKYKLFYCLSKPRHTHTAFKGGTRMGACAPGGDIQSLNELSSEKSPNVHTNM